MGANIQAAIFHVFDLNLGTPEGSHTPVWCHQRIHFQVLPPRLSHLCFFLLSFHQSTYLFISLSCTPFNPMNYFESGNLIELSMYKQCIMKSRDVTLPTKVHLVKAMVFPIAMYGCESWTIRKLSIKELMLLNCGVGEDSWESLGLQGDQTSHFYRKLFLNIIGRTMLKLKLQLFGHLMGRTDSLEKPWCWERLKARGEGDDRGWDGWMASPTRWTWVWVDSGYWWWTGRPDMLWFMRSQRVRHDWVTELNWTRTYWQ